VSAFRCHEADGHLTLQSCCANSLNFVSAAPFVPISNGHGRKGRCLCAKGTRRQTAAHEQRASEGRQVAACKGHQRADEFLHVKNIRRHTSAGVQRASEGRQVLMCKGNHRADRWLYAKGIRVGQIRGQPSASPDD